MAVALTILTRRIPRALEGQGYSEQMRVAGGTGPYSWQVAVGFGSLPPGMSLSAAGVLSAAPGAIPATAVGTYNFRLQVTDSVPTTVFLDYSMDVLPSGYDTVPNWLLDPVLRSLADRLAPDPVIREKAEIHFFRGIIGVMGNYYAHYDEDIYCPDWRVPGNNLGLRDVLEAIYTVAFGAVRTINTLPPDVSSNFTIQAGTGISVTPVLNGVEITNTGGAGSAEHEQTSGTIAPGATLTLNLLQDPSILQASLYEPVSDAWIPFGNIPSYAGKKLNPNYYALSLSIMGMASGADAAGTKVLHVCWCDMFAGGTWHMSRLNQETMAVLEDIVLSPPIGSQGYPGVAAGCVVSDVVFAAFIDLAGMMYYVALDPSNYANAAPPFVPVAAPILVVGPPPLGPPYQPMQNGNKVLVALSPTLPYAYVSTLAMVGGNFVPVIIEFSPAPPWTTTGRYYAMPWGGVTGGSLFDMIVDDQNGALPPLVQSLATFGVDQVRWSPAADNFMFWNLQIPIPVLGMNVMGMFPVPGPWVVSIIENINPGDYYRHGCIALDDVGFGITRRTAILAYTTANYWNPPLNAVVKGTIVKDIWGPAFPSVTTSLSPPRPSKEQYAADSPYCGFTRWYYYGEGTPQARIMFFDWFCGPNGSFLQRTIFDASNSFIDSPVVVRHTKSQYPIRMITTTSMYDPDFVPNPGFVAPFVYFGDAWSGGFVDNVMMMADPHFTDEDLRVEFRAAPKQAVVINDSPFEWTVKIDAVMVSDLDIPPENLMIACYQFAQAMKRYHDAATWYPSPSTVPGVQVNWSENQVATTNVGGFQFDSYYSVTPGGYDLEGGTIAAGRYFADEVATTSQDYTFVFRYTSVPAAITAAEVAIKAALDAFLLATPPLPHGTGINPNFYTLPEVDAICGTAFATTYVGAPYDNYRYFLFTNTDGLSYEHGFFSKNYVDTGVAYGPHPASSVSIPVQEHFTVTVPGVGNVSDFFDLSTSVSAARVYVNGVMYLEGIDWGFTTMNRIEYFNRQPGGFVLTVGSIVTVDKWNL